MKKCLKEIIIVAAILYFVLSLGYSIIVRIGVNENLQAIETDPMYQNMDFQRGDESGSEYINMQKDVFYGENHILNTNIQLLIVSIGIGIMVGLIRAVKENSWIKYILIFIFGNVIYTGIWTIIDLLINVSYGNDAFSNFTFRYMNIEKTTIIYYIIVYIAVLVWMLINNKSKVENLNKSLKSTTKEKNNGNKKESKIDSKKIKKIIISVLVIVFISIAIMITRRSSILINYSKKLNEINSATNYYLKEEYKYADGAGYTSETYVKDGVYLEKTNEGNVYYRNRNTKESFSCMYSKGKLYKSTQDNFTFQPLYMLSEYFMDNSVRIMGNIVFSFNVGITSENLNGKDCYVIKYIGNKLYVDKETYLVVRKTQNGEYGQDISDYTFEEGIVTEEDVQRPSTEGLIEIVR